MEALQKEQQGLRINGAHGKSDNVDPNLQVNHYNAQITLSYIVLMKRLGLGTEIIDNFERSSFLNSARWKISQQYANDVKTVED